MGFSILVTVCTLAGLLFCFRRASQLLPRNLNIQLQMFGQNNNDNQGRGPIALSDDDIAGATGLDWEDLEAQLHDDIDDEENIQDEELQDMASRPLKPMTRSDRYLDDDDDEENQGQELSSVHATSRYRDDDDGDTDDVDNDSAARSKAGQGTEGTSQQANPFKLDDDL
ncbi:hypothetical protein B0O80DRAFT_463995 [Mortierella sp. GBAus27b]|nr:hypothetical protein B0O80DRAFT_463995 [Mortierella sp. GBAus27b]